MINYIDSTIISNEKIASGIYDMTISYHKDLREAKPGQFAQVFVPKGEHILPRPISLCGIDKEKGELRLVYQVVGKGTQCFSRMRRGDDIKILAPLGNGFDINPDKKEIAVVGGGIGIPPLLELVKTIKAKLPEINVSVFLGFRSETFLVKDFTALRVNLHISTDDGSMGFKGNVLENMKSLNYKCDLVYACGPKLMLKGLNAWAEENGAECFVSMEERMACGIGACVGCVIPVKTGADEWEYKKVCKDGPVFNGAEVVWE